MCIEPSHQTHEITYAYKQKYIETQYTLSEHSDDQSARVSWAM